MTLTRSASGPASMIRRSSSCLGINDALAAMGATLREQEAAAE
ncbi:MAG TPA: hypothetical protein VFG98_05795 [Intrasporangium sp.]|nr:hypothetical protein [Intrasporangium sp.]